jgi:peptide/nickel transport system substrate-binding protein
LFLALCLAFAISGCGGPGKPEGRAEQGAEPSASSMMESPPTASEIEERVARLTCAADRIEVPTGPTGGTFRFNILDTPNSLDPAWIRDTASDQVAFPIHNGLVEFDPTSLEMIPCLAAAWDISDDGLVYTFHLRPDVFFHDDPCFPNGAGRELVSTDFKYSFERICDPRVASPGAWMFLGFVKGAREFRDGISAQRELERRNKGGARDEASSNRFRSATVEALQRMSAAGTGVEGFACSDLRTFVVILEKPFSPFLYRMGHSFSWPVPREAVEKYGDDFFKHPVGVGPFRFIEWVPDQRIILERNPKYWQKDPAGNQLPYLDRIEISQINDANSEHLEFLSGHLDLQYPLPMDRWEDIFTGDLEIQPNYSQFQVQCANTMRIEYIGLLNTDPLFKNMKVRQALNYAVNREEISATILRYRSVPNGGSVVPRSMPGYPAADGPYHYDPKHALELLEEAGYPEGKGLPEITLQLNSQGKENVKIAEVIQGYFAAIGITMKLQVVDWRVHLDTVREGKVPFFRIGWLNDYPSPENSLMLLATSGIPPEGENYARYSNPEFDRLYEAALASTDSDEQNSLFAQAEELAVSEAPWIFLYDRRDYRLLSPRVRSFPMNALDRRYLKYVWLAR